MIATKPVASNLDRGQGVLPKNVLRKKKGILLPNFFSRKDSCTKNFINSINIYIYFLSQFQF